MKPRHLYLAAIFSMAIALLMPVGLWAQSPSVVTLASSLNPSTYGQPLAFTATVTPGATGTVTFTVNSVPNIPAPIINGIAVLDSSEIPVGPTNTIAATYSGDTNFGPSSTSLTQAVSQATSSVSLSGPQGKHTGQSRAAIPS